MMRKLSMHFTRRQLVILIVLVAILLALLVLLCSGNGILSQHYNVATTEGRLQYLHTLGWEADAATETVQDITLPREFDEIFSRYNDLQRQQGFDLRPYAGLSCKQITYALTNYDTEGTVLVQLFLYHDRIIGGDIHATALDGFMHGIIRE